MEDAFDVRKITLISGSKKDESHNQVTHLSHQLRFEHTFKRHFA